MSELSNVFKMLDLLRIRGRKNPGRYDEKLKNKIIIAKISS